MEHPESRMSENPEIAEPAGSVLAAAPGGIIVMHEDGVIHCFGETVERLFGQAADEAGGPDAGLGPFRDPASAIAHELSEALTAISNYSEASRVLLDRGGSDRLDAARANLAKLQVQVARAGDILGRLRDLAGSSGRAR